LRPFKIPAPNVGTATGSDDAVDGVFDDAAATSVVAGFTSMSCSRRGVCGAAMSSGGCATSGAISASRFGMTGAGVTIASGLRQTFAPTAGATS
jgi:hypothetical protein